MAAEGHLEHNGSFKVSALGMPPNERREDSIASAKVLSLCKQTEPKFTLIRGLQLSSIFYCRAQTYTGSLQALWRSAIKIEDCIEC